MTTRYASGVWPRVARRNGIHEATYYWRVRNGWDPGRAATEPPNDRPEGMLTTPEVADLLGVSFRQLDYWSRTNLIRVRNGERFRQPPLLVGRRCRSPDRCRRSPVDRNAAGCGAKDANPRPERVRRAL